MRVINPYEYQPMYFAVVNEEAIIVREVFEVEEEAKLYAKKLNAIDHCENYKVQPCQIVARGTKILK